MKGLSHLNYLSKPLGWYIREHTERQSSMTYSHSGLPCYTIDDLVKRNKHREYKGVHAFCAAEELGETVTCVIFKKTEGHHRNYFHSLYLGPETQTPNEVHELLLKKLGLTESDVQKSLICCSSHDEHVYED
jgi:hypothetical protein